MRKQLAASRFLSFIEFEVFFFPYVKKKKKKDEVEKIIKQNVKLKKYPLCDCYLFSSVLYYASMEK